MTGKRSSRNKVQRFYCPHCTQRLWRLGGVKHYLLDVKISDPKQNSWASSREAGATSDKKKAVAPHQNADKNRWIEAFHCPDHGKMWMLVCQDSNDGLSASLAPASEWQHLTAIDRSKVSGPSGDRIRRPIGRRANVRVRAPEN
ncbi:hypothetical protein [Altericista sp. CCNU0014]|uniref:hypothetical protein n=1 Tax=Altericista sp. CCNU0014 TaxID=3082949 RepID=UPI00384EA9CF